MKNKNSVVSEDFLFFYFYGIEFGFPLYFAFFISPIDPIIIHNFLTIPMRTSKQFVPTLSCSSFADICTRWHARTFTYAYACIDEKRKCKRGWWWLFVPRIRTAWLRVGTSWVSSFFCLFCFVAFITHSIVVSSCRWCECISSTCASFYCVIESKIFSSERVKYYIFFI